MNPTNAGRKQQERKYIAGQRRTVFLEKNKRPGGAPSVISAHVLEKRLSRTHDETNHYNATKHDDKHPAHQTSAEINRQQSEMPKNFPLLFMEVS